MSRINKYMAGDCLISTIHQTQGLSASPSLGSTPLLPSPSFVPDTVSIPTTFQDPGVCSSPCSGQCYIVFVPNPIVLR